MLAMQQNTDTEKKGSERR